MKRENSTAPPPTFYTANTSILPPVYTHQKEIMPIQTTLANSLSIL